MLNQEEYDPRKVDIWSSGVLLYAMIHGYLPFEDEVTTQLYEKIKTKNVRVASSVSIPCRNLLRGLLTKSPAERWDLHFIKRHDFLAETIANSEVYVEKETKEIDLNQFKQICEHLGIVEEDRLLNNLRKNKHNNLTTLFYLGKKQILRTIGENISSIASDKAEESISHSSVEVFQQSESATNERAETVTV
jgi:5'-AMP-activated protein kinase catalytic alpha subunit